VDVRDALAAVLARVVDGVTGTPRVVLTCPAGWGAPRRAVLVEAAARAGLAPVTLVSEPVAAAAHFTAAVRPDSPPDAVLAVVDVGAGTADVAVVRTGAAAEMLAHDGVDV